MPRRSELSSSLLRARADEITRACLVTPYDRKLLRCVDLGAPLNDCKREFDRRRATRD